MKRNLGLAVAAVATYGLCLLSPPACAGSACKVGMGSTIPWAPMLATAIAAAVILVVAWSSCLRAGRAAAGLPSVALPQALVNAASRAQVSRVRCVESRTATAFCAGLVGPWIYISDSLVGRLSALELEAVLLHEEHHRRHHEPLLRSVRNATANLLPFLPVVRWWATKLTLKSELAADMAAITRTGKGAVARALLALEVEPPVAQPAFSGAAELRLNQLLGNPLPLQRPPAQAWAQTVAALATAATAISCAATVLALH